MVSNFDRIFAEIRRECAKHVTSYRQDPDVMVSLVMDLVDIEDRHRRAAVARVNQIVEGKIQDVALKHVGRGA